MRFRDTAGHVDLPIYAIEHRFRNEPVLTVLHDAEGRLVKDLDVDFDVNLNLVACNDDQAGCSGNTSQMVVPVACDDPVLIRLGGYDGASGTGTLSLAFSGDDCRLGWLVVRSDGRIQRQTLNPSSMQWEQTWGRCPVRWFAR